MSKYTKGPWEIVEHNWSDTGIYSGDKHIALLTISGEATEENQESLEADMSANAHLIAAAPELLKALHEGRRAIGDHFAPNDCYATGPLTGDPIRDLVQCPACSFIAMYDAAIAKVTGEKA